MDKVLKKTKLSEIDEIDQNRRNKDLHFCMHHASHHYRQGKSII